MTTPDFARVEASWENAQLNRHLAGIERGDAQHDAWERYATENDLDVDDSEAMAKWLDDTEEDAREAAAERLAEDRAERQLLGE